VTLPDTHSEAAVFRVEGLAVRAGERRPPLLAGIDFALAPGEAAALAGPSGSGKTTLLRALALLDEPASGRLELDGRPPEAYGLPGWRRRVVYVAQEPPVHDDSVLDCLRRPFRFRAAESPFDEALARELLAGLGLDPTAVLPKRARTLSVGERQRLGMARALLVSPRVLLLDEPTSALDQESARRALELVTAYVESRRAAALVVTHDLGAADRHLGRRLDVGRWRVSAVASAGAAETAPAADAPRSPRTAPPAAGASS
jgi:ABC-type iron transport system FetAB ATPase subunit